MPEPAPVTTATRWCESMPASVADAGGSGGRAGPRRHVRRVAREGAQVFGEEGGIDRRVEARLVLVVVVGAIVALRGDRQAGREPGAGVRAVHQPPQAGEEADELREAVGVSRRRLPVAVVGRAKPGLDLAEAPREGDLDRRLGPRLVASGVEDLGDSLDD